MKMVIILSFIFAVYYSVAQPKWEDKTVYLLIRGDDMASSQAANAGCLKSYNAGILQSVELMPVGAWFPEAVKRLNENPGLDAGVHLTLTSEWSFIKWRPLTTCQSLTDSNGYFFPMVWKNNLFPPGTSIQESAWKLVEVEKELRAQIEMAKKNVPHVSHVTIHMGFNGLSPEIGNVIRNLAKEYGLFYEPEGISVKRFPGWGQEKDHNLRIDAFCRNLENLKPGIYLFVEHPSLNTPEMQHVSHPGYDNVALDREWVTRVFTSEKVKKSISDRGIKLISYKDLR